MKKNVFNFMFVIGLCAMLLSMVQPVSAKSIKTETITYKNAEEILFSNELNGLSTVTPLESILMRGTAKPSSIWNLKTSGTYSFEGGAMNTILYTEYLFTGTTKIKVSTTSINSDSNIHVELWERRTGLFQSDIRVSDFPALKPGYTAENTIVGLNKSSKYYVKFINPAFFSGTVSDAE